MRGPKYISQNTQSASIAVNGGTPVIVDLSATSGNCVPAPGGGRTCTATVNAPVGADTFTEIMYAGANGTGAALSQNTTSATIVAGQANSVAITLEGIVASIGLALANPTPQIGVATTTALTVTFKDASGAAIVGTAPFTQPITLTDSDTTGATKLSATVLNSPQDESGLTVAYNGAAIGPVTFGATAAGVPAAAVSAAVMTPQGFVDWPTYGFDSQRSGYNPSTTAVTPASVANYHLVWQTSIGNAQSQPVVVTNAVPGHKAVVIVSGYTNVQAFDAVTGVAIWTTNVPVQDMQECGTGGAGGTVLYVAQQGAIYVAGGDGQIPTHDYLYKFNVATGAPMGSVNITPTLVANESVHAHTAATYANGLVYLGTSSNCEGVPAGPQGLYPSWRGRVVAVDPSSMSLVSTFYPTYGQGANYGGGGIWAWGGVSADVSGNIYVAAGNAETNGSMGMGQSIQPPFVPTDAENAGYANHLLELSANLSSVVANDAPAFQPGLTDLDYTGTPVVYQPPLGSGCGQLTATQGKGGLLVINDTGHLSGALNVFTLSIPSANAWYVGNPAYSPSTGMLYAAISSTGGDGAILPPGMAAISGCGANMTWNARFGPDSSQYAAQDAPRSAPTVTAGDATGGVVFMGTPCTNDGSGGCGAPSSTVNGAVWAVNSKSGEVLGNAKPIVITDQNVRMAPTVDGQWMFVLDDGGNLYALSTNAQFRAITAKPGRRTAKTFRLFPTTHH